MAHAEPKRTEQLRDFVSLCGLVGCHLEPHQKKIALAVLGPERRS